jgi:hypothetical protein
VLRWQGRERAPSARGGAAEVVTTVATLDLWEGEVSTEPLYGFERFNLQNVQSSHVNMTFEREGCLHGKDYLTHRTRTEFRVDRTIYVSN